MRAPPEFLNYKLDKGTNEFRSKSKVSKHYD